MDLELSWIQALQAWLQTPFLRSFVAFQARWLIVGIGIASVIAYAVERGAVRRHAWKELGWSVGLAAVTALALSLLFAKTRPFLASTAIEAWIPPPSSMYAFPSMHAAVMWAWAASLTQLERSWVILWACVAFLVSFARVASGVHHVSDVVVGGMIGVAAWGVIRWGHRASRVLLRSAFHDESPSI
ncbi:phosphatase PAP2 family protein [Patescibacteria group bacterium]|nr:phosphatase PAP2 family protein [Patescibacteria group bacterium]